MSARYLTKAGDTVDLICWRHYGRQSQAVEAVIAANPRLADPGPILPAGRVVELPDLPPPTADDKEGLW